MAKQWYVIHTYSGKENEVKRSIETKFKNLKLEDRLGEVLVPTYDDPYLAKDGKKKMRKRKTLPGYVLVNVDLDDAIWAAIKTVTYVTNFVGAFGTGKPKPLSDREVSELIFENADRSEKSKEKAPAQINFLIGEHVKVIDGPFSNFSGVIEEVFPEKGRVRVKVEIFGRGTPVELDYLQVGKI
ncbi:MAG TPA: transcription termination/antitermination protein NusG [Spirochaetota bacterium]|nr:transcription termination/antitermination factor NusG [Spirochaetota bacterium]HOA07854.1 transcription termination/antitermination protein NusG [Spirochaetota bacterium]HOH36227.1 transcription termination/antitermination protein NusG [Spirochaetota bacterium]